MGRKAVRIEYSEPGLSDLRVAFYNYVKFKNKIKLKKKKSSLFHPKRSIGLLFWLPGIHSCFLY